MCVSFNEDLKTLLGVYKTDGVFNMKIRLNFNFHNKNPTNICIRIEKCKLMKGSKKEK